MKIEEAIVEIKSLKRQTEDMNKFVGGLDDSVDALNFAIQACEKQIAKKPIPGSSYLRRCPICNFRTTIYRENFCGTCGQKIDWGKEE